MATTTEASRSMRLTPHVEIRSARAVVNAASGSVGGDAAARLSAILFGYGLDAEVVNAAPEDIATAVKAARDANPDLLIVLAGDGTAGLAATCCGPAGPLLICLPGGTMNMLPFAVHGRLAWEQALHQSLRSGRATEISGGVMDGKPFYVAAIVGSPALWAKAREAVRKRDFKRAWMRAVHAFKGAFRGRLRFTLGEGPPRKAEALTLMCPRVSRAIGDDAPGLEAAVIDVRNKAEIARLGLNMLTGDWRRDPAIETQVVPHAYVWARRRITALLDGETVRFDRDVDIGFTRVAFRALVAAPDDEAVR